MVGIKVSGSLVAVICLLAGIAAGQIQAQEATPQVRCKFRRGHMIGVCVSSVVNATTYDYVVTAVDVSGESGYSNQITAVIP